MPDLITNMNFRILYAVRGATEHAHLAPRETFPDGLTLCGQFGPLDARGRQRFTRIRSKPGKWCNACAVAACREPTRVDWS